MNILLARYSNIEKYTLVFQYIQEKLAKLLDHTIFQEY
jgi:hypothetical protein